MMLFATQAILGNEAKAASSLEMKALIPRVHAPPIVSGVLVEVGSWSKMPAPIWKNGTFSSDMFL